MMKLKLVWQTLKVLKYTFSLVVCALKEENKNGDGT